MPVDLLQMVSQDVRLARVGNRHRGRCPFHEEKTPSFYLIPDKDRMRFHCFGCGAHGDAIDWVRLTRNVSFKEAVVIMGQERPARPTPEMLHKRRLREQRDRMLWIYRNRNPDCCLPEWIIA